jgi:hypothetical protein
MILANVIFPAPSAVYVATIFFPLAAVLAIVTELSVFAYFQKGVLSRWECDRHRQLLSRRTAARASRHRSTSSLA